jgi:hypothetical protein
MDEKQAQLIIPPKIRAGFRERNDTYKQILGFVVRLNEKGEQTNLKAWEGWRDKKLPPKDFTNEPTEGFVLNKGVGGARRSYGWNARVEKVRVHDPRGWEIEIDVDNLLNILKECDCSRGKGLEGKFVYAWNRQQLVLLPVGCLDYENSKKFTELQGTGVGVKELVAGTTYVTKKQEELTYLGRFDYHFMVELRHRYNYNNGNGAYTLEPPTKEDKNGVVKRFVFWNGTDFVFLKDVKSLSIQKSDAMHPDFADLIDKYNKSAHGSKVVKLFLKEIQPRKISEERRYYGEEPWYFENADGEFVQCQTVFKYDNQGKRTTEIQRIDSHHKFYLKDGVFISEPHRNGEYNTGSNKKPPTPTNLRLYAETENGGKIRVDKVKDERYGNYTTPFQKDN